MFSLKANLHRTGSKVNLLTFYKCSCSLLQSQGKQCTQTNNEAFGCRLVWPTDNQ